MQTVALYIGMKCNQPLDRLVASSTMRKKLRTDMLLAVNVLYILHVADELVIFDPDGVIIAIGLKRHFLYQWAEEKKKISVMPNAEFCDYSRCIRVRNHSEHLHGNIKP